MSLFRISHLTTYHYSCPVKLGDHRLMLRPRDSHDLRLLEATLRIKPAPVNIRWQHDVFGNSIAVASFAGKTDRLEIESNLLLEQYSASPDLFALTEEAQFLPFAYDADEIIDLGRTQERQYPDPERVVDAWAKQFCVAKSGDLPETMAVLTEMTQAIKETLTYVRRDSYGTRPPAETLELGEGSCRDFALLMMEAVRSLGLAAQFVTGYVYDPSLDHAHARAVGAGTTHAWLQVYLPGAGWLEFDPTNAIVGNEGLIRVAVVRDPRQASPVSGAWHGPVGADLAMTVEVRVEQKTIEAGKAVPARSDR